MVLHVYTFYERSPVREQPYNTDGGGGQGFEKIQAPLHTKKIHYPHSTIKFYPYAYNLIFYIPKLNCFHENRLFITLLKVCQWAMNKNATRVWNKIQPPSFVPKNSNPAKTFMRTPPVLKGLLPYLKPLVIVLNHRFHCI